MLRMVLIDLIILPSLPMILPIISFGAMISIIFISPSRCSSRVILSSF